MLIKRWLKRCVAADKKYDVVLDRDVAIARATLRRWVGTEANQPLAGTPPALSLEVPHLQHRLGEHPDLRAAAARVGEANAELAEAVSEKKPDWGVEFAYNNRDNQFGDMVMLQFTFDLPMFVGTRQGPKINAKQHSVAHNFVLPTEVQATLKQLAGKRGTNMTEALKELIGEALETEKHHQTELKTLKKQQSEAQQRLTEKKKNAERQVAEYARSVATLNRATKELAEEIRKLLRHKVENELGISRGTASPDDLSTLNELHTEELEKLKKRFKLEHAIEAFSDRPPRKANARTPRTETPPKADKR